MGGKVDLGSFLGESNLNLGEWENFYLGLVASILLLSATYIPTNFSLLNKLAIVNAVVIYIIALVRFVSRKSRFSNKGRVRRYTDAISELTLFYSLLYISFSSAVLLNSILYQFLGLRLDIAIFTAVLGLLIGISVIIGFELLTKDFIAYASVLLFNESIELIISLLRLWRL